MKRIDHWITDHLEFEVWESVEGNREVRVRPLDDTPKGWAALTRMMEQITGKSVEIPGELKAH